MKLKLLIFLIYWGSWLVLLSIVLLVAMGFGSFQTLASEMKAELKGGGEVRLMNRDCYYDREKLGGYFLSPFTPDVMLHGCWIFLEDTIHFRFDTGEVFRIPWKDFSPVIDGSDYVPPNKPQPPKFKDSDPKLSS